jgi:hypothetical protein
MVLALKRYHSGGWESSLAIVRQKAGVENLGVAFLN